MHRKINLHLLVLLSAAVMLFGGCKFGNTANSSAATNGAANSNSASPPSRATQIYEFKKKAKDLMTLGMSTKLDPKAKIKGKVAIASSDYKADYTMEGFGYGNEEYSESTLKSYGLEKEDLAITADEIDTLIQIDCTKGNKIGVYKITDGRTLDAYANECEVEVGDYTSKTVFSKKSFVSKNLSKEIKVSAEDYQIVASEPGYEIGQYVKTLQNR